MAHVRIQLVSVLGAAAAALWLPSCMVLPSAPPADTYIGVSTRPAAATRLSTKAASQESSGPAASGPAAAPLSVTLDEAIVLALENNPSLNVERLTPLIRRTVEQEERAAFDPDLTASVAHGRERAPVSTGGRDTTGDTTARVGVSQALPTGTDVTAGVSSERLTSHLRDDQYVTRLGMTVNQALLRGAGLDVNLADVRQARLGTRISEYELRGFAEALVAETERTYWNYALAQRTMEIVTNALDLAEQQLKETQERVRVGALAEIELAASQAEVARRRENLINARSLLATTRLRLLRLMNPAQPEAWDRPVVLTSAPGAQQVKLDDVETYVQVALRRRPELNQARLGIQQGDLELVKTRNGLLPRMDLFLTLGKSGYAESFGRSVSHVADEGDYDVLAGVSVEYPPGNRAAEARHERAVYSRDQAARALENLVQLAQEDVRAAYIEVERSREQVTATAATRRFQEETLRAETEKFRVGNSTSFLVAQAQRDLLASQIAEVGAVVSYLRSLIDLHLQEGALLDRRGISAPGIKPVDLAVPQYETSR